MSKNTCEAAVLNEIGGTQALMRSLLVPQELVAQQAQRVNVWLAVCEASADLSIPQEIGFMYLRGMQ